jgi:hypothetical protein
MKDYFDGTVRNSIIEANQRQHQYMAEKYIDLIDQGLKEFDTRNHNNPDINMDHYRALAWEGLGAGTNNPAKQTKAWKELPQQEKDKINSDRLELDWVTIINCN